MTNRYHLLVESKEADSLPRFMHWVQLGYARYYKKKFETTGHVFEERYRSPRIAKESYYLQCGRYIERNPVKACPFGTRHLSTYLTPPAGMRSFVTYLLQNSGRQIAGCFVGSGG